MSLYKSSLVLIVDANSTSWNKEKDGECILSFGQFLSSLQRFVRAYFSMSSGRDMYLIAKNRVYCKIIFQGAVDSSMDSFSESLLQFISEDSPESNLPTLSSSLYIALCYLNRIGYKSTLSRQILLIDYSSKDMYLKEHIPLLNIGFSALNMNIPINILTLGNTHSQLLEQLSYSTKGTFLRLMSIYDKETLNIECALFQTLLFWFLSSDEGNNVLSNASLGNITNTAVCYCHNKPIEIGFLCSSCLTVYCTDTGLIMCKVCSCRFTKRLIKTRAISELNLDR